MTFPIRDILKELMLIPGLSGHEQRVAAAIRAHLDRAGVAHETDRLGNLAASFPGAAPDAPSVMVFAHMDQLGFVVSRIEPDGFLRVERLGGVPERALPAQAVLIGTAGAGLPGVIASKSHHATAPEEKYRVLPYRELYLDAGFASAAEAEAAGARIGAPVTYLPRVVELAGGRLAGTAIDDRAGCAVLLGLAEGLSRRKPLAPTVHLVWSVQEEFNLRGVLPAANRLKPDIALQIDLMLAADTPDMETRGAVRLGGGPAMSLYSFHGRGTLNGLIPHPALVRAFEDAAAAGGMPLQRSAQTGVLTDASYLPFLGEAGIACLDIGFPLRHTHSALEVVDPADLDALLALLCAVLPRFGPGFALERI